MIRSLILFACSITAMVACSSSTMQPSTEPVDGAPPSAADLARPLADVDVGDRDRSDRRGVAWHFCGWDVSGGEADLEAMRPDLAWYYNWSSRPMECPDGTGVVDARALQPGADGGVEFVPMAWGLVDDGAACDDGDACFRVDARDGGAACEAACAGEHGPDYGPGHACWECLHEPISRDELLADIPGGSEWLLGFNEPNFREQAGISPQAAARAWRHVEWVADQRDLGLVGPAVNFCDATPGARHAGACIDADEGHDMQGFAWLERFYDACSADGVAGYDCRIDHQALHVYTCWSFDWYLDMLRRKAGLLPGEDHCVNGVQDGDEFGVDCGGNGCVACSERARELFGRPVWLTEFAPASNDCEELSGQALLERAAAYAREVGEMLERDPLIYRYAWFMPRVGDWGSLGHVDLLGDVGTTERTPTGDAYFGTPAGYRP